MVYASSLYDFLFNAANRILADSFATGHVSVGLCQSLSLLSVWKKPSDQNAWLRVGYAIRWVWEGEAMRPGVYCAYVPERFIAMPWSQCRLSTQIGCATRSTIAQQRSGSEGGVGEWSVRIGD